MHLHIQQSEEHGHSNEINLNFVYFNTLYGKHVETLQDSLLFSYVFSVHKVELNHIVHLCVRRLCTVHKLDTVEPI
jgi:hypothetical protein